MKEPQNKKECCEKCKDKLGGNPDLGYIPQCSMHGNCQCHSQPAEPKEEQSWEIDLIILLEKRYTMHKDVIDFVASQIRLAEEKSYDKGLEDGETKGRIDEAVNCENHSKKEYKRGRQEMREIIENKIPLYRAGVLEKGETNEYRNGRNAGLKEVREVITRLNKEK